MSRIVFTLGLALLFAAAGLLASRASHRADFSARNQEAKVPLDQTFGAGSTTPGAGRAPAVPPLDQQQPAKIETATFALG